MTHGTIAGVIPTDLIQGRSNPWTSLYHPSRIKLRAAGEFTLEKSATRSSRLSLSLIAVRSAWKSNYRAGTDWAFPHGEERCVSRFNEHS